MTLLTQDEIEEGDTRATVPPTGIRSPPVLPEGPAVLRPSPLLRQASIEAAASCRLLSIDYGTDAESTAAAASLTKAGEAEVASGCGKDVSSGMGAGVTLQAVRGEAVLACCVDTVPDQGSSAQHAEVSPSCMQVPAFPFTVCSLLCVLSSGHTAAQSDSKHDSSLTILQALRSHLTVPCSHS